MNSIAHIGACDVNLDVNNFEMNITETLYMCSQSSVRPVDRAGQSDINPDRWEKLLNDTDDARVWKAIN